MSSNKSHLSHYLDGPPRQVPGFHDLHKMTQQLLAERVPNNAHILVLGAGGGLELEFLAQAQPGWRFAGVDPSAEMLELAKRTTEPYRDRIQFYQGYIDSAPHLEFDGAISLLTFHFIAQHQRLETLTQLQLRLKPNAPLILAHISFPQSESERQLWINRHLTYAGVSSENRAQSQNAMLNQLSILPPATEEQMLKDAGFSDIDLFYAGLSFKGWAAYGC